MSELVPGPEPTSRSELRTRAAAAKFPGIARHGRLRKASPLPTILKFIAATLAVVLVSTVSVAAIAVNGLTSKADIVELVEATNGPPPQIGAIEGGFNILIVGSDTRESQGGIGGDDTGAQLNDVNIMLHVSEDQTNAVAVSFPRDMVVGIPECEWSDGSGTKVYSTEPLNVALSYGGLPCAVLAVEELTGLDIQFAGLITFKGVIRMSDALGGVDVCVDGPVIDSDTGIKLKEAGTHNLKGFEALAFLRTRHGVGDGSDITRISSQQVFLSAMVRKLKSSETLGDFTKVYGLADAAVRNMQLSSSLANLDTMASIALALKDIPLEDVTFVQYPGTTGNTEGLYAGKVKPNEILGDEMMSLIKDDKPFKLDAAGDGRGSTEDPDAPEPTKTSTPSSSATAEPTEKPIDDDEKETLSGVTGQTAADYTCSVSNSY